MKKSRRSVVALLTVALATLAATTTATAARMPASTTATSAASCTAPSIGLMAPITGPAATFGKEIRDWTKYSAQSYNKANGTKFKLVETDTKLDPVQASKRAAQLTSNSAVLGVVGPASSTEVLASAPIFNETKMPFISGSATRTTLTDGSIPTFSRVVPNDSIQGPTTASFIRTELKPRKVVIIDDQTAYSVPLANSVHANLTARGITVDRKSVNQNQTDYSALVATVGDDVGVVYLPWRIAANGQLLAQQMKKQGKKATIVGSDGLFSRDFTANGAYVFNLAPDIRSLKSSSTYVKGFTKAYPNTSWGTFGPPAFLAAQVLMTAIDKACADGKVTREEVAVQARKTKIAPSILGGTFQFTANGDVSGADFYLFQIKKGKPVLVN